MALSVLLKTPTAIAVGVGTLVLGGTVTGIYFAVSGGLSSAAKPKRHNYVLFEEARPSGDGEQITGGNQTFKCKLEGGAQTSLCALSKVVEPEGKSNHWVTYTTFKNIDTDPNKLEGFITEDKTVYKAKVSSNLIDEWAQNQDKKLNIFDADVEITSATKPLTTVIPKFAVKHGDVSIGKSKYMLGKVKFLPEIRNEGLTSFETKGKYFKCDGLESEGKEYQNCDIYYFDENDEKGKDFNNKTLKTTLKRADSVSLGLHYLIKFDGSKNIEKTSFDKDVHLDVKAFNDESRSVVPTTGVSGVFFEHLSHVVVMGDGEDSVDLALIL